MGTIIGGFGTAVLEFMAANNYKAYLKILGIPDTFMESSTVKQLQHDCHYDSEAIVHTIRTMMNENITVNSTNVITA